MKTTSPEKYGLTSAHIEILRDILAPFTSRITRVAIFGSRATGDSRPGSDIDLVLYGNVTASDLARIRIQCIESLLPHTVDIVAYELLESSELIARINREAQTLFTQKDNSF